MHFFKQTFVLDIFIKIARLTITEVTRMRRADIQEITLKFSIYYFISLHFKYIKMTIYLFYSIIIFNDLSES